MQKIAIVGPSGAGKTTLARKLSSTLNINAIYLDRLFWQRDWEKISNDNRIDILQELIQEKMWIIEGTYINSSDLHLSAADTIIFLDIHPLVCLLRLINRYRKVHGRPRRDIPEGCTDKLTLYSILKVITFPFRARKTLQQKLSSFESKEIICLRSKNHVEVFLAEQVLNAAKRSASFNMHPVARNHITSFSKKEFSPIHSN